MDRKRLTVWRHADGRDAAFATLTAVVKPHAKTLLAKNTAVTAAETFKQTVPKDDIDALQELLLALFTCDARGGVSSKQTLRRRCRTLSMKLGYWSRYLNTSAG